MASAKTVVAASEAVEQTPAPPTSQPDAVPAKVVRFWKMINPFEKITFNDGSELVFGQQGFVTADEKLIKKISEVAKNFGILVQNNGD